MPSLDDLSPTALRERLSDKFLSTESSLTPFLQRHERIVLAPGSYDPPHREHLNNALATREFGPVIFLPSGQNPLKEHPPIDPEHRTNMILLSIQGEQDLYVTDFDYRNQDGKPVYAVDTVQTLQALAPNTQILYVIGDDIIAELHRWRNYKQLFELCDFSVIPRDPSFSVEQLDSLNPALTPSEIKKLSRFVVTRPPTPLASSEIRNQLREGALSIPGLLPEVERYARKLGLYR